MDHLDEIKVEAENTDKTKNKNSLNDQEQEEEVKVNNMSDQDKNQIEAKNMNGLGEKWPEPIVRVQSLAESKLTIFPDWYIKPPSQRPQITTINYQPEAATINIPIIDLDSLFSGNEDEKKRLSEACREWGFFQVSDILFFAFDWTLIQQTKFGRYKF